eukprot:PhM_4_TR12477/c0_g1_i1/m.22639/K03115/CSNK2B; casein kinase II subunit beta
MIDPDDDSSDLDSHEEEDEDEIPWISWFCSLKGNEFFCEIDEEYIHDDFNLTGLSSVVPFYSHALDLILDLESTPVLSSDQQQMVEAAAETLYGLIHARFLLTPRGLKLMEEKYRVAAFGRCPRVLCGAQAMLPVGQSDVLRESSVKLFCPRCEDIYYPRSSRHKSLDGAFWGTTFAHLLIMTLQQEGGPNAVLSVPRSTSGGSAYPPAGAPIPKYVPRIFGFRVRKMISPQQAAQQQQPTTPVGGNEDNNKNQNTNEAKGGGSPATVGASSARHTDPAKM